MKEEEWIEALIRRLAATGVGDEIDGTPAASTALGPGDDAALIPLPAGEIPVLSADTMVEGVHFRDRWLSDRELGARILRVSLSDLAAMAARPRATLLAIETPELPGRLGEEFLDGIEETLSIFRLSLAGGNLTRTPGPLAITCTVIGGVLPGEEVRRQGARAGDTLWVTGRPGEAGAGRRLLGEMEMAARDQALASAAARATRAWRRPEPRIDAALELKGRGWVTAAIDVSDGLAIDLCRLLGASGVGARIELGPLLEREGAPALEEILGGGEDYELLLAAPADPPIDPDAFARATGVPITPIGIVTGGDEIHLEAAGAPIPWRPRGWDHFA